MNVDLFLLLIDMKKYYLSKNYVNLSNAGNKAKTDIEFILLNRGFTNIGLRQTCIKNELSGFILTLMGVLKACISISEGSWLVLQYPLKKYFLFICKFARLRGGKVITIIHDLGSFRKGRLTVSQEIKRLNNANCLIVHNKKMESWLKEHGSTSTISCLEIFDYLSEKSPKKIIDADPSFNIIYAGALSYKKNAFLYKLEEYVRNFKFTLYGSGFDKELLRGNINYNYKGFVPSDELIATADGHFGLVWDGDSISCCSGIFGEYLKYNNPHKTSLYIRCHLPIIIWSEAALADFVKDNNIGICIDSLEQINDILSGLSKEEYDAMRSNVVEISRKLSQGYYVSKALGEVFCKVGEGELIKV